MKRLDWQRKTAVFLAALLLLMTAACQADNAAPETSSPAAEQMETASTAAETSSETPPPAETETETEPPTTLPPATEPEPMGNAVDWVQTGQEMQSKADALVGNSALAVDSFQFAVMDCGEITVSGTSGSADREGQQTLTSETVCGIASVSKIMAVAAVMQLVDEGKVELDAPAYQYLPEWEMPDPRYQDITVRMLMNHSSGLMGNTCLESWRLGAVGEESFHDAFFAQLNKQRLKSDPGAYSVYCNDGFTLLEFLCEAVSGEPYAAYLRTHILQPLDMTHTFAPTEQFDTSQVVRTYFGGLGVPLPVMATDAAQGGMFSTAEDLCRFGNAFTRGNTAILNPTSVEAMEQAEYLKGDWCEPGNSAMNYGLGWDAVDLYPFAELGIKAVTKNGDIILSGSQLLILPEYHLVAAVTGTGSSNSVSKNFLVYALLRVLQEKGVIDEIPAKPGIPDREPTFPAEMDRFAGVYVRSWGAYRISFSGDQMIKTAYPGGKTTTYRHIGGGHFTDDGATDYWFIEKGGRRYQVSRAWDDGYGLISLPNVTIQGTQQEESALPSEQADAWKRRNGQTYLLVSEPGDSFGYVYSSYGLAFPSYQLTISVNPDLSPYWRGMRITGTDTAVNAAEVPIIGSTNAVDAAFSVEDGVEYLMFTNGTVYRSANGLPELDPTAAISVGDRAAWYRSSSAQTLAYQIPAGGAIAVYDADLKLKDHTVVMQRSTVSIPAGGYVAFIGEGTFQPQ